ncbi:MAG: EamA family transporter [Anaerolineales bacterium]|nr:EamA family transporter [Anaerolineales bacterium]
MSASATSFRRGLILIVFASMMWGTTGLTSKVLNRLSAVDALSVGALRLLTAFPALLLLAQALAPGSLRPLLKREWRAVLIMGAAMAGYNGSFFAALARTSVTAGTLLALCTAPLFVALLARIFLHEPLTRPVLLALGAGLSGTALLVGGQGGRDLLRLDYALGNLLALAAGLSYAVYALVGRAKSRGAPAASLAALSFTTAAILLTPFALANGLRLPTNSPAWLAVLYLGLIPTALAYALYLSGLRSVPATMASIGTLIEPLTASLLAALFLGERLTPSGLLGAGLLLSSLAILSFGNTQQSTD